MGLNQELEQVELLTVLIMQAMLGLERWIAISLEHLLPLPMTFPRHLDLPPPLAPFTIHLKTPITAGLRQIRRVQRDNGGASVLAPSSTPPPIPLHKNHWQRARKAHRSGRAPKVPPTSPTSLWRQVQGGLRLGLLPPLVVLLGLTRSWHSAEGGSTPWGPRPVPYTWKGSKSTNDHYQNCRLWLNLHYFRRKEKRSFCHQLN
mmetsp:Transcript_15194/g.20063  ORF Transcript_15194/g.20063 Transcript_15194/m.20063 type:complete len:203 (+) Transcript_15194:452-1060(+)